MNTRIIVHNATMNCDIMFTPESIEDAATLATFDRFDKVYRMDRDVVGLLNNNDVIQIVEVTLEAVEQITKISKRHIVYVEVSRKVLSQKIFKFSKKNGASWK